MSSNAAVKSRHYWRPSPALVEFVEHYLNAHAWHRGIAGEAKAVLEHTNPSLLVDQTGMKYTVWSFYDLIRQRHVRRARAQQVQAQPQPPQQQTLTGVVEHPSSETVRVAQLVAIGERLSLKLWALVVSGDASTLKAMDDLLR